MKKVIVFLLLVTLVTGSLFAQRARDFLAQGREHLQAQRFVEAIAAFEEVLKMEPRNRDAPALLNQARDGRIRQLTAQAQEQVGQNNFSEAIAIYEQALQVTTADRSLTQGINNGKAEANNAWIRSLISQAQAQVTQNNFSEALALYDSAQRITTTDRTLTQNITNGRTAAQRAQQQANEQAAREAMQKANELFIAYQFDEAISEYEKVAALDRTQNAEAQRLITAIRNIKTRQETFNRPLADSDFDIRQAGNTLFIANYKATESISVRISGREDHTFFVGILDVVIPERLFGQAVAGIDGAAFAGKGLTGITIPATFTEIGDFSNNRLERVTIPNRVTRIGARAFSGNPLTEITIPDSVTVIEREAFANCRLTRVTFGRAVQTIGWNAFENNQLTTITLPASIRVIEWNAFARNQITTITLPASTREIGRDAFRNNQIQSLILNNGIEFIGEGAFMDNPLTTLVVPASLAQLGRLVIPSGITGIYSRHGGSWFNGVVTFPRIAVQNHEIFNQLNEQQKLGMIAERRDRDSFTRAFPDSLTRITMPANMHDDNLAGMGNANFVNFYNSQNKAAGTYVLNGPIWTRQ